MQLLPRIINVEWPKKLNKDAAAFLVRVARTGHQRIMKDYAAKGVVPEWEAYANTPGNTNLDSVKVPGPIVYNYHYQFADLIEFALEELRRQSPVISGDYKNGHTVFLNGQPIGARVPKTIKAGDNIFIANLVPYARRLEVGRTKSGRTFLIQVPNRIYERVAATMNGKLKGAVKISMGYVDLGAWSLKNDQKTLIKTPRGYAYSSRQRPDRVAGSAVKSPAIFFTVSN